jgi:hypothetical protein
MSQTTTTELRDRAEIIISPPNTIRAAADDGLAVKLNLTRQAIQQRLERADLLTEFAQLARYSVGPSFERMMLDHINALSEQVLSGI